MNQRKSREPANDLPPGLAQPVIRALTAAGLTRLELIAGATEAEVLKLHGMGPNAMQKIREALNARGLTFAKPEDGRAGKER